MKAEGVSGFEPSPPGMDLRNVYSDYSEAMSELKADDRALWTCRAFVPTQVLV